jgi:rSAM/selenodomain-associated transferase 2
MDSRGHWSRRKLVRRVNISIIIPTLNEAVVIEQAATRARDTKPLEVIVADGGSTDDTLRRAGEQNCRVIQSAPGRGIQLNAGCAAARGDVLLMLHADNWLEPDALQQIISALQDTRVLAGAFHQRIESPRQVFRLIERGNALRAARCGRPYGDQGIFMRREVFEQLGGFPPVPLMEDVLLMRRFRRLGRPVLLPGPIHVSPRRWEQHGVLRQTLCNWLLLGGLRLGVAPERLASFYRPHRAAGRDV